MEQTQTRHTEKSNLFQVLKASYENDFISAIASLKASMDKDDIAEVMCLYEEWKKEKEANK